MSDISDITDTERWIVETTLKERYGDPPPKLEFADAEIRLNPADRELSLCPVFFWEDSESCHFVIFKTGENRYRCQFFYRGYQQYGTGVHEYDDLTECTVSLLQAQADYAAREHGNLDT